MVNQAAAWLLAEKISWRKLAVGEVCVVCLLQSTRTGSYYRGFEHIYAPHSPTHILFFNHHKHRFFIHSSSSLSQCYPSPSHVQPITSPPASTPSTTVPSTKSPATALTILAGPASSVNPLAGRIVVMRLKRIRVPLEVCVMIL